MSESFFNKIAVCEIFKNTFFYRSPPVATSETKHIHVSAVDLLHIRKEIWIGMRAMKKKLNIFMLQLPIYYILEWKISIGANADIAKTKREK